MFVAHFGGRPKSRKAVSKQLQGLHGFGFVPSVGKLAVSTSRKVSQLGGRPRMIGPCIRRISIGDSGRQGTIAGEAGGPFPTQILVRSTSRNP